jgi:hypothetical protein
VVEAVNVYLEAVWARCPQTALLAVEQTVDLNVLNPPGPMFGTADALIYVPEAELLHVLDFKYGRGHVVDVIDNPQLLYYALGGALWLEREHGALPERVEMTIVQPRAAHTDGIVRSSTVSLTDLVAFAQTLMAAARRTIDPSAPLVAGTWCRWCPASPVCPAQSQFALTVAQAEFTEHAITPPPPPEALTDAQVTLVLDHADVIEKWLRGVRAYVQARLERGETFPGYKLVQKRATRRWRDSDDVYAFLAALAVPREEAEERRLRSPAQVERLLRSLGKAKLPEELVIKSSSGYTLAPDADPRPEQQAGPAHEFGVFPADAE